MASSDSLHLVPSATERGAGDVVAARYQLIRKVGSGGMGSVWYAHDLSLDAPCAVKLIDGEKANDENIRMRFEREAKASAQLRSAHVVNVFDFGVWNRTQYLAMEYLEGEDLSNRLLRLGRLDFEATYRVIAHVARALMAAHSVGIVHRDLKPENIFLVQNYEEEIAKVLDFGIAQHHGYSLSDKATREGAFLGTPCYVSPEQARGRPIDHRSDLWSLGVIAFQCLTGQLPFEGTALGELMGQILYEPLPKPSLVAADNGNGSKHSATPTGIFSASRGVFGGHHCRYPTSGGYSNHSPRPGRGTSG
jgi:serine/threonine-protein kinase